MTAVFILQIILSDNQRSRCLQNPGRTNLPTATRCHDNHVVNMSARREKKEYLKKQEPLFVQWVTLSHQQIQELQKKGQEKLQTELMELLDLRNNQTCLKEGVLLHYYVCGLWWATEAGLTPSQTSFIMAVLQMLLDNIRMKRMGLVDNLMEFVKALGAVCPDLHSEEDATSLLDNETAAALTRYITNNVIQKYRLYEGVFNTPREELLTGLERVVDMFICLDTFTPLEEAISICLCYK